MVPVLKSLPTLSRSGIAGNAKNQHETRTPRTIAPKYEIVLEGKEGTVVHQTENRKIILASRMSSACVRARVHHRRPVFSGHFIYSGLPAQGIPPPLIEGLGPSPPPPNSSTQTIRFPELIHFPLLVFPS